MKLIHENPSLHQAVLPVVHKAMRWLDEHDIEHEKLDVIADEAAYEEMVRLSGQELAPAIEADGKVLADFGPEELAKFWGKINKETRKP